MNELNDGINGMNRSLKRALLLVLFTCLALALWGYSTLQGQQAVRDGDIDLNGLLAPVEVLYDEWGIPHIYAENQQDALRALGYVHAQDRLFQMDLLRRTGAGTLSELFGEKMLDADKLFRTLSINQYATGLAQQMRQQPEREDTRLISAYQSGINQYIATRDKPLEYQILRVDVAPFTLEDIGHTMGYMAYSFANAFKTDPLYHWIAQTLGNDYLNDLAPIYLNTGYLTPDSRTKNKTANSVAANPKLVSVVDQVLEINDSIFPAGHFIGSNSWALSSERTQDGKPILANDPHIGIAVPAVWYEAHIVTPDFEVYGHYLAGIPFAMLGNNRHHAWGLTMFENDDIDFYQERANNDNHDQVWHKDQWQQLALREEIIRIKGEDPVTIKVRTSSHGPIITDLAKPAIKLDDSSQPVAMFWTFLDPRNDTVNALYQVNAASNMQQFESAVAEIWAPGLNINYADTDGNIAMWASARLPNRPPHVHSMMILDGASGNDDINDYLDFSHNPRRVNPANGVIFSANHPYQRDNQDIISGYYTPADRAERLNQLLNPENNGNKKDWTPEQLKQVQLDTKGALNSNLRDLLLSSISSREPSDSSQSSIDQQALQFIQEWDLGYPLDSIAATIFERTYFFTQQEIFNDELGDRYEIFIKTFMADHSFQQILANSESPWWDNQDTDTRESREQILRRAWQRALASLQQQFGDDPGNWQWSKVHSIEHPHPLGKVKPLNKLFNVGPFAIDSSKRSLSKMSYNYSEQHYRVTSNPSTRRIIPLSDIEQAQGINPVGQSGNPFDPHFDDQAAHYNQGGYRSQLMNRQSIEQAASGRLQFHP